MSFSVADIRQQFPLLDQQIHDQPLVYLDNAATTQKPAAVIQAINNYYGSDNANVHRGAHHLSERATLQFEAARQSVRQFINAASEKEIIWTRGTTESLNLIAQCLTGQIHKNDEILLTELEHHANIVPWQMLAQRTGAVIRVVPILANGDLDQQAFGSLLNSRTKIVSLTHVSNALGTVNPLAAMVRQAKAAGATVIVDGAQAVAHMNIDVQRLGCDFYVFSGHKMYGPTGTGVLYGRQALLEAMPPWQGGGEMIRSVSFDHTEYNDLPFKFEAGTPNIAGAVGLMATVNWLNSLDRRAVASHEQTLLQHAIKCCEQVKGFTRIGAPTANAAILSFQLTSHHQQDVGLILDQHGVAVRTGHHCAMPLMNKLGLPGTIRASFAAYNTTEDVERFAEILQQLTSSGFFPVAETVSSDKAFTDNPFGKDIDSDAILGKLEPLTSWNDRYREIMLLGKQLPHMTSEAKVSEHLVKGCESSAWLDYQKDADGHYWFSADADARVIRGLIALVLAAVNGKTAEDILQFDIEGYLKRLQLMKHLSPSRGNGLLAIIARIREIASA
ncbi:SufS family cysteine desulfurase [Aliamphritea spongicola]|uniref:SufS family cysteine desulfurase n=1 Tax=Aliamphritea spongicola TaxID=707589 RepID=UPI00196B2F20|nr:SufS family cysteine desulfurase [Aliamphritea spongicola]MBN3560687.1 SufS family cysteine desulfurase [Aliamphritea spongicola]